MILFPNPGVLVADTEAEILASMPEPYASGFATVTKRGFLYGNGVWRCTSPIAVLDFGLNGTYSTTSGAFAQLGFNVALGSVDVYSPGGTAVFGSVVVDTMCDVGATGEFDLFDITNGVSIPNSATSVAETSFTVKNSMNVQLTPAVMYRIRFRKVTGAGSTAIYVRAASIVCSFT